MAYVAIIVSRKFLTPSLCWIDEWIKWQEDIDFVLCSRGRFERNDMVRLLFSKWLGTILLWCVGETTNHLLQVWTIYHLVIPAGILSQSPLAIRMKCLTLKCTVLIINERLLFVSALRHGDWYEDYSWAISLPLGTLGSIRHKSTLLYQNLRIIPAWSNMVPDIISFEPNRSNLELVDELKAASNGRTAHDPLTSCAKWRRIDNTVEAILAKGCWQEATWLWFWKHVVFQKQKLDSPCWEAAKAARECEWFPLELFDPVHLDSRIQLTKKSTRRWTMRQPSLSVPSQQPWCINIISALQRYQLPIPAIINLISETTILADYLIWRPTVLTASHTTKDRVAERNHCRLLDRGVQKGTALHWSIIQMWNTKVSATQLTWLVYQGQAYFDIVGGLLSRRASRFTKSDFRYSNLKKKVDAGCSRAS